MELDEVAKQITALASFPKNATFDLASAVGVMQHHDAITGTQVQEVEKDYHKSLSAGILEAITQVSSALTNLLGLEEDISLSYCPLANVSICQDSKKDNFRVLLYNPLGRTVSHYVQIPVDAGTWTVTDPDGRAVTNYLYNPVRSFQFVADDIDQSLNEKVLMFMAENLPPLGYKIYEFARTAELPSMPINSAHDNLRVPTIVGYENNYVVLDGTTGFVITMAINGIEVNVTPKVMFYYSDWGSGTYMFKPDVNRRDPVPFSDKVENQITHNVVSAEIKQEMRDWGVLTIRIYPDTDYIEIDWLAGPIDVGDESGKDVIIKYTTDLETNGIFYTDSNSRELIKRQRNYRPTFEYTNGEPQSGNYYPITSRMVIKDKNKNIEFAVITDRAEGGSSLNDGEIELMVHRSTLRDEFGEHLYEMEYGTGLVARGSHYITFGPSNNSDAARSPSYVQRDIAIKKHLPPLMLFPQNPISEKTKSYLSTELPENIHLLTLEKWSDKDNTYLIRLEHFLEKNDDIDLSKEVEIDLENLFTLFRIVSAHERTLNGVTALNDVTKLQWPQLNKLGLSNKTPTMRESSEFKITLAPMQIRTFVVTIEPIFC
ncbi:hypothetical protein NQ318_012294 [Aromia moschata]|uniref:Alpha-mannosidase n=1 Tax=Aromia moschata TaxID=1265417 RepID=A0AAV8YIJ6_9CUCU|nr:hypothetical protein NQ318_012294 [Aromia moschata]